VQLETVGRRGHTGDPLYAAKRTLPTGTDLLTDRQRAKINALFAERSPHRGRGDLVRSTRR
jgi:transposase